MRSALLALAEIKSASTDAGDGRRRSGRRFGRLRPIFPVADLAAALAHYAALGFATAAYADGDDYGFADRDGVGLHLAAHSEHDPAGPAGSAYLYVRDADALYEEWSRPGIGGRTRPAGPTPYGLREGSHIDPDGNLIRFGSPVGE
jgi:catechol 2,3-dioxygenase-like lactoylglutathione lyase family enzyme